jgi:hypothetical protein
MELKQAVANEQQQTDQSSQAAGNQSASQDQGAQGDASNSQQATGGDQSRTNPPARPDYVPDNLWDPDKSAPKPEFAQFVKDHVAFKAAEDSRRLTLPQKPEDYKIALPKDFKPPEGVEFKLDENDPLFAQARTWAKENGLSQEAFEKGLGMIAARDVATQQMLTEARNTEIGKLGANGTARVTALNTFLDAKGVAPLKGMMVTAEIVQAMEKLVSLASAGGNFSQQHRDAPEKNGKIEGYDKMSFEQRRAKQDELARQPARR